MTKGILALAGLLSAAAVADSPLSLQYSVGRAALHGDLGASSGLLHDFQIGTLRYRNEAGTLEAFLAIEVLTFSAQHGGTAFPFPAGSDLRVLAFLFIPNVCPVAHWPLDFCLGIGQGTVNVNAPADRRDFGSWNYQLLVRYRASPTWSAHVLAKYVGQVEQTVAGVPASFGFTALGAGLGWTY